MYALRSRAYACMYIYVYSKIYSRPVARKFFWAVLLNLLITVSCPGAVEEFTIAWCMLIAHIHEGLNNHGIVIVLAVASRTCSQICGLVTSAMQI